MNRSRVWQKGGCLHMSCRRLCYWWLRSTMCKGLRHIIFATCMCDAAIASHETDINCRCSFKFFFFLFQRQILLDTITQLKSIPTINIPLSIPFQRSTSVICWCMSRANWIEIWLPSIVRKMCPHTQHTPDWFWCKRKSSTRWKIPFIIPYNSQNYFAGINWCWKYIGIVCSCRIEIPCATHIHQKRPLHNEPNTHRSTEMFYLYIFKYE